MAFQSPRLLIKPLDGCQFLGVAELGLGLTEGDFIPSVMWS